MMHQIHTFKPHDLTATDLDRLEIDLIELLTRRRFIIGAGGLIGAAALGACGAGEQAAAPTASAGVWRIFPHARGTTDIPVQPQRVALMNDFLLNPVLAAGYAPIASGGRTNEQFGAEQFDTSGIEHIGLNNEPSLERLSALRPDLIIGIDRFTDDNAYDQLSQIAPTILINTIETDLFAFNRILLDAIGRLEVFDTQVAAYEARLAALRPRFDPLRDMLSVNVLYIRSESTFAVPGRDLYDQAAWTVVLNDLDLALAKPADTNTFTEVSLERLPEWDADVLFVVVPPDGADELLELPLLQQLNAARQGQVHAVPIFVWNGWYIPALVNVLNDLETYLLDQEIDTSFTN